MRPIVELNGRLGKWYGTKWKDLCKVGAFSSLLKVITESTGVYKHQIITKTFIYDKCLGTTYYKQISVDNGNGSYTLVVVPTYTELY